METKYVAAWASGLCHYD